MCGSIDFRDLYIYLQQCRRRRSEAAEVHTYRPSFPQALISSQLPLRTEPGRPGSSPCEASPVVTTIGDPTLPYVLAVVPHDLARSPARILSCELSFSAIARRSLVIVSRSANGTGGRRVHGMHGRSSTRRRESTLRVGRIHSGRLRCPADLVNRLRWPFAFPL